MTKILAISEANAIAFHSMAIIAQSKGAINATRIAEICSVSKHHTAKVLQTLVRQGLLGSTRGPQGGFYLKRPAEEIFLIDILEALEGPVQASECPVGNDVCVFGSCIMGGICYDIADTFVKYLKENSLKYIVDNILEMK